MFRLLGGAAMWVLAGAGLLAAGCGVESRGIALGDGGADQRPGGDGPGGDRPVDVPVVDAPVATYDGPRAVGFVCHNAGDCLSGFCVDGVCCDTACTGVCEACAETGTWGTCRPVTGEPRAGRAPCVGQGKGEACAGSCDGVSATCSYPAGESECGVASCTNGEAVGRAVCSGTGVCLPPVKISCAPFTCAGAICAGGCAPDRPCAPGNFCSGGRCLPVLAEGNPCTGANQCASGACVDGSCCARQSCGSCEACSGAGGTCTKVINAADPDSCTGDRSCSPAGLCAKRNGQSCAAAAECVSGHCASGRCCNRTCTAACESCNLTGAAGTCATIPFTADADNCGACGARCSSNHVARVCTGGRCVGACDPGFGDCDGNKASNGCETALGTDANNCGSCGMKCPGTRCEVGMCEKIVFGWSSAGPIAGQHCVLIEEPADIVGTWTDNFLCTQRDFGLRWSYVGAIPGMVCTSFNEPSDPDAWTDNFLCAPVDHGLLFSVAGPVPNMRCTQILEAADPHTWNDNYLCAPP